MSDYVEDQLRDEVLRLQYVADEWRETAAQSAEREGELLAQIDTLKAEVERLREALESIVHPTEAAKNYIDYGIGYAHTIGELISACRKAYDAALRGESRVDQKRPPPPEDLVDALQDRVHPASGPLISSKPALRGEEASNG
jgi:hypothetical protein